MSIEEGPPLEFVHRWAGFTPLRLLSLSSLLSPNVNYGHHKNKSPAANGHRTLLQGNKQLRVLETRKAVTIVAFDGHYQAESSKSGRCI
jgi:hypothetical protein